MVCFFFFCNSSFHFSSSGKACFVIDLFPLSLLGLQVVAIIDMDCADVNGFDETDRKYLEQLAGILAGGCDW